MYSWRGIADGVQVWCIWDCVCEWGWGGGEYSEVYGWECGAGVSSLLPKISVHSLRRLIPHSFPHNPLSPPESPSVRRHRVPAPKSIWNVFIPWKYWWLSTYSAIDSIYINDWETYLKLQFLYSWAEIQNSLSSPCSYKRLPKWRFLTNCWNIETCDISFVILSPRVLDQLSRLRIHRVSRQLSRCISGFNSWNHSFSFKIWIYKQASALTRIRVHRLVGQHRCVERRRRCIVWYWWAEDSQINGEMHLSGVLLWLKARFAKVGRYNLGWK